MELDKLRLVLPALKRRQEILLQIDPADFWMQTHAVEVRYAHVAQRKGVQTRKHRQLPDALWPLLLELMLRPSGD